MRWEGWERGRGSEMGGVRKGEGEMGGVGKGEGE